MLIVAFKLLWCWSCVISPGVETVINLDSCPRLCCVGSLNLREFGPWKFLQKSLNCKFEKGTSLQGQKAVLFFFSTKEKSRSTQQLCVYLCVFTGSPEFYQLFCCKPYTCTWLNTCAQIGRLAWSNCDAESHYSEQIYYIWNCRSFHSKILSSQDDIN